MRRLVLLMMMALVVAGTSENARAQAYGTEAPFVLGTGARASAMGVAGITLYGDATAQYYNPSALTTLQYKEFAFFRSVLFDSKSVYHTVSYAHPLMNHGTLAISVLRLDVGGIEERDINNQLLSDDLNNSQTRVLLGYSRQITSSVSAGANFKIDNQSFGSYSGSGIGLDVGLSAMQPARFGRYVTGLRQGLVIHNLLEPSIKLDQESVADPMQIGVGFSALSAYGPATMVTSLDLVSPRYSPTTIRFGQEVVYSNRYALRLGLDRTAPTFGFGAEYRNVTFDYAYRGEDVGANHRFALAVKFGDSVSQRKAAARLRLEETVNEKLNTRMSEFETSQIKQALAAGDSLYERRSFESAVAEYEKALLWEPQNGHAREYIKRSQTRQLTDTARQALTNGDYVQGLFYAKRALNIDTNNSEASKIADECDAEIAAAENTSEVADDLLRRAIDLYAQGDFRAALAGFDEVLKLMPVNALAAEYHDKSQANLDGEIAVALRDARDAVRDKQYDSALTYFDRVLVLNPTHGDALKERKQALKLRTEAAATPPAALAKPPTKSVLATPMPAKDVDPAELETHYSKGMSYFEGGEFEKAAAEFFEVWKLSPDYHNAAAFLTKAYLFMGMQHYSGQNYADAIAIWRRVLEIDPTNAKARRYLEKADEEFDKLRRASND